VCVSILDGMNTAVKIVYMTVAEVAVVVARLVTQ